MRRYRVIFSPEARRDINSLYDWIALNASPMTARRFIEQLETFILKFDLFPRHGTMRADLGKDVRTVPYRKRHTVAFRIVEERGVVEILEINHTGRDFIRRLNE